MLTGNLRNMEQGIDAGLKLYECAEVCHSGNSAGHDRANSILLCCTNPGILLGELQGKSDLCALDILDQDAELLANLEDLLGILDTAPAHLGDVEQSVCAAKVDECAEICDILDGTLDCIAGVDGLEELALHFLTFCNEKLLAITNISAPVRIVLGDYELDVLSEILAQVSLISIGNKACRDEYSDFLDNYAQAAGKDLCNLGCEDFLIVVRFLNALVTAVCREALVGKDNLAVSVIDFQDLDFKFVAYVQDFCEINRMIVRVLIPGKDTIGLGADIQDRLIGFDIDDLSLDYLTGMDCLERFVQHLFKGLL